MDYTKQQLKIIALSYLETNRLMSLATVLDNKPWSATVFFAYDDKLNLYFFSRPDTIHCQHIKHNPNVSVAINQNWGTPGNVKGIQITGIAKQSDDTHEFRLYLKRYQWALSYPDHLLYSITPKELYMVNHEVFDHFFRVQII